MYKLYFIFILRKLFNLRSMLICCSIEGEGGTGYISVEEFLQVLLSPDLGFHLESDEQSYIAAQVTL